MGYGQTGRQRILVVDDEPLITLTLSAILEEAGYEVRTAFNGEEAVEKAAMFGPDLLLTDITMGEMSGIEAAVLITAMQPECKVLFLSGHAAMIDTLESPPERLVYSFMTKPARVPDLLDAISYMLPAAPAVNDQPVTDSEHDPMHLRNLARTALARLDAWRIAQSTRSNEDLEREAAFEGAEGYVQKAGQPPWRCGEEEQCHRTCRHPIMSERRSPSAARATSAA